MSKYLVLEYNNAKLFPKDKSFRNKDKIVTNEFNKLKLKNNILKVSKSIRTARRDSSNFVEPITVNQISNALHKLFGERPVPSFREVFYLRIEHIYDMAMNSYLNISSPKIHNKFNNKDEFISEMFHTNKALHNSYSTIKEVSWDTVRRYLLRSIVVDGKPTLSNDFYDEFINIVKKILGDEIVHERFMDVREKILASYNDELDDFNNKMKSSSNSAFYYNMKPVELFSEEELKTQKNSSLGEFYKKETSLLTISRGVYLFKNLSGKIYVPVSDEDIQKIRRNTVKILDGGLLRITGIQDGNYLLTDGFIKVSEISTEKY